MSKSAESNLYTLQTILYLGRHPHPSYCVSDMHSTTFRVYGIHATRKILKLSSLLKNLPTNFVGTRATMTCCTYLTCHLYMQDADISNLSQCLTSPMDTCISHKAFSFLSSLHNNSRRTSQFHFCRPRTRTDYYQTSHVPSLAHCLREGAIWFLYTYRSCFAVP